MINKQNKKGFTLIEIMVWILIVSIVLIWWFQALIFTTIWKSKLIQRTDIQKESFYFTEKLFEMIKQWWTIDYEEYFNRKVIWNTTYSSWHFSIPSGFWNYWKWWTLWSSNFWDGFYYCRSWNWISNKMTWTWCFTKFNSWTINYSWEQQRYWEYSFQFIDYNSNYDNDLWTPWDEDWDWNIIWDDDDEYLGVGPVAFDEWKDLTELYLINWDKTKRTLFRWVVDKDPYSPWNCSLDSWNNITWTWCIWNVEYLKLEWKDRWMNHDLSNTWSTQYDWITDTWIIDTDFTSWNEQVAWTWSVNWVKLFPSSINVSEFKVYWYPNKNIEYNWKNNNISSNISPYVIIKMKLKPSWVSRRLIKWEWKELDFSMTVNLTDVYTK